MNYKKLLISNIIYILILELVFKFFVIKSIDIGLLYIPIFAILSGTIFTLLMSLFKKRIINKVISYIIWILTFLLFTAQTIYYSFYKTICGISALNYGNQVMEFYNSILSHVVDNILLIFIYLILTLFMIFLSIKYIKYEKFILKDTLAIIFASIALIVTSLEYNYQNYNARHLLLKTNDIMQSTVNFGIIPSVASDAIKISTHFEEDIEVVNNNKYKLNKELDYNVTSIDFDSLSETEKNKTIKNMHEYFKGINPTNKNDYTSIFAGKNLIFITAEGFSPMAIDEKLTPTLYKLANNSFIFKNYYQPIFNCSTSDGEFINLLSLLPGVSTCSMKKTTGVSLPYNIGNIFKDYGYNTYAFHGWTYTYYNRHKTMPSLGFKYYGYDRYKRGYKYALKGIKDSWPTSDIDVVNSSSDIYMNDENFVAYYMSISGHLEYNFTGGNAIAKKNKNLVKDMKASDKIKAYVATQIEFDKSLKILMDNLESKRVLDDTVIVIAADHYPYGLTNDDILGYADYVKDENFDIYKNSLIIYNNQVENTVIDKYVSSIDLLPTLLNMFGIRYDSRLLMGVDIMSSNDNIVIFNNKSWITNKGKYDFIKKKFYPFKDNVDDTYVDKINDEVKLKFQMSKLIVSKDYYRKVMDD